MPADRSARARESGGRQARGRPQRIPKERTQFRRLLAGNANYFGNMPEAGLAAVQPLAGNTAYEEVTCVGYNPPLRLLEATVQVKQAGGYGGPLCLAGTPEYVRFFLDYGSGWVDVGLASFNAHDLPNARDCAGDPNKPLSYVVSLELDPETDICRRPVLPAVRAILSWNLVPPPNPNWVPVWGNVLDDHIQIKPRKWLFGDVLQPIGEIIEKIDLPPLVEETFPIPIPIPDPPPLALSELLELYAAKGGSGRTKGAAVEAHRFASAELSAAVSAGGFDPAALASLGDTFKPYEIDLSKLVDLFEETKANVGYEEVECVGLEYNLDRLVASFRVKRPTGYSGDLCTAGSQEYVAFWADWDDTCDWTYLGTVSVNVHDIAIIPAGGLSYSAILPVDLTKIRRPCKEPRISRIRAVLSWATPPSTVDPDALTTWGNRLDTHVQVKPGDLITEPGPLISIIGGIGLDNIDVFVDGRTKSSDTYGNPGVPFASFGGNFADEWAPHTRKCPFGGLIKVQGPSFPGYKYRLWAHNTVTNEYVLVKSKFFVTNWLGIGSWQTPDPITGYSWYLSVLANMENVLAYWTPPGDDLWEIRLEMASGAEVVVGSTPWYLVQLDNSAPVRKPKDEAPMSTDTMSISIETGGGDCADFTVGDAIGGRFVARDPSFGAYGLTVLPSSLGPNPTAPSSGIVQTAPALPLPGGNGWTLNTAGMEACGYVIVLNVWDRSIVHSRPGVHNHNFDDVGFCLREP
jgi:hypothetical protein